MRFNLYTNHFEDINENPSAIAVAGSDKDLTWTQLQQEVEKLSDTLHKLNIPKGHPIIIYGHKESFFMASIIACIKNNIPYVPIDTVVPLERINKIKELMGSQVVIFTGEKNNALQFNIEIKNDCSYILNKEANYKKSIFWREHDPLIYIIFTSGSTGEPKGVQITQDAIRSYIDWMECDYGFTKGEVFVNQAPFSFDLSVYEVMFFMHLGGRIILNDNIITKKSTEFVSRLQQYKASAWVSTPSFAYLYFLEQTFNAENIPTLKTFLFCGEELPNRTSQKLLSLFPNSRVINTYGPTEATVSTTFVNITKEVAEKYPILPVGYPKYTCEILIENESNNPEDIGEITIVGDNISIGYFKNDELNKEKFYIDAKGKRAYKTGDFGYIKDGMLFFLGRQDDQVKLNGYRIELGDINAQICKLDFVDDAVTAPLKAGNTVKRIVSFVKLIDLSSDKPDAKEKIIQQIKSNLPEYMLPSDISFVKEFPFNSSHKIDKKKLVENYLN